MTKQRKLVWRPEARGMALIMVMVVLSILLSLTLPFLLSVTTEGRAAMLRLSGVKSQKASLSLRNALLRRCAGSDPALDDFPDVDSPGLVDVAMEFPHWENLPDSPQGKALGEVRQQWGGEIWDAQSRIAVEGATPLIFANILGWSTFISEPVDDLAMEIPAESTSGFEEQGFLWVLGELIQYDGKTNKSFLNCTRGVGYDEATGVVSRWMKPRNYFKGIPIMDARAWHLATYPVYRNKKKSWSPWSSFAEMRLINSLGHGELTPVHIERLRSLMTLHSSRRFCPAWVFPQRLLSMQMREDGLPKLYIPQGRYFGKGSIIRIRGGGQEEYGIVANSSGAGMNQTQVLTRGSSLILEDGLLNSWENNQGVVEVLAPVPVNVNTASVEVIANLFTNLRNQKYSNRPQGNSDSAKTAGAVKDWISRSEAGELAKLFVGMRQDIGGEDQGPFSSYKDLVDRVFKKMQTGEAALSMNPELLSAVYRNFLHSRDRWIILGTSPLSFWSGPIVGFRSAVASYNQAGGEWSRSERSGLAFVRPEGFTLQEVFSTQAQFDEVLRLSRGAQGWLTLPSNTSFMDSGNDPPSRNLPHGHAIKMFIRALEAEDGGYASSLDGTEFFPFEGDDSSAIRPAPARFENPPAVRVGQRGIMHMHRDPDPEGRDLASRPFLTRLSAGGRQRAQGGRQSLANPVQSSFWFKPSRGGSMSLLDIGRQTVERDRLHVFMHNNELVLEMLDSAGIDPEPGIYNPTRTAACVRLPMTDYPVNSGTWYHFLCQALGSSPERLTLMVDGVPRGRARFMAKLTAEIPPYDHQTESERYLDIQVDDAKDFPPQGTLRIGTELFEYVGLSGNTFTCRRADSRGGRDARHSPWEWDRNTPRPPDETVAVRDVPTPEHLVGETVVLYGYSIPLQDNTAIPPGELSLPGDLGRWGVARMVNQDTGISVGNRVLGQGIDEKFTGDLELGSPTIQSSGGSDFMGAFGSGAGYALLCQRMLVIQGGQPGGGPGQTQTKVVGGLVTISYQKVDGNKLSGVRYNVSLPWLTSGSIDPGSAAALAGTPGLPSYYDGQMRSFVGKWGNKEMEDRSTNWAFVVPISVQLGTGGGGNLRLFANPEQTGCSEYLQILPKRQTFTEWVRYDAIIGDQVVRCRPRAVIQLLNRGLGIYRVNQANATFWPPAFVELTLDEIKSSRADEIGFIETGTLPLDYWCGYWFRFRGARETKTSTHTHQVGAMVQPVFRVTERWGATAALSGRPGRKDRIALVDGNENLQSSKSGPQVEWHTVNWVSRLYYFNEEDPYIPDASHPCGLVALSRGLTMPYYRGDASGGRSAGRQGRRTVRRTGNNRQNPYDIREFTRMVKFPSGELPWRFEGQVHFGMPQAQGGEGWPADGLLDEVEIGTVTRGLNGIPFHPMLAFPVNDKVATKIQMLTDVTVPGLVVGFGRNIARAFPRQGGLIQIGSEIMAYSKVNEDGSLQIATNGRGLLGTEVSGHGMWEHITILERPAATTLSSGVDGGSPILPVERCDHFPANRGLILIDQELIHYTYSRRFLSLEMPARQSPVIEGDLPLDTNTDFRPGDGLFRGRFGTPPAPHDQGTPVIVFPCRYWDTYARKADAPEMHHFDFHLNSPRAFFKSVTWDEELPDGPVDLQVFARIDSRVDWRDDPRQKDNGLYHFTGPTVREKANALARQGNLLSLRFFPVYKSGVFDPISFLAQAWKMTPTVRKVTIAYEAPTVIMLEKEAGR